MRCHHCHRDDVPGDADFCPWCGAALLHYAGVDEQKRWHALRAKIDRGITS